MNLSRLAASVVASVNPWSEALYRPSTGATSAPSGKRAPIYGDPVVVRVQKQALSFKDLAQTQGLNLNGEKAAFYVDGNWLGVSRPLARGGDLVQLRDGTVWLIAQVLENWNTPDGWTKVAATLQNEAPIAWPAPAPAP